MSNLRGLKAKKEREKRDRLRNQKLAKMKRMENHVKVARVEKLIKKRRTK
jgi:hypothetical protein